jgi:hypothetical protein
MLGMHGWLLLLIFGLGVLYVIFVVLGFLKYGRKSVGDSGLGTQGTILYMRPGDGPLGGNILRPLRRSDRAT